MKAKDVLLHAVFSQLVYFDYNIVKINMSSIAGDIFDDWDFHKLKSSRTVNVAAEGKGISASSAASSACVAGILSAGENIYVFVNKVTKQAVFAFQGTADLYQKVVDMQLAAGGVPTINPASVAELKNQIGELLAEGIQSISFTGHSLGGYVAIRIALLLISDNNIPVYAFDAPGITEGEKAAIGVEKPLVYYFCIQPNFVNTLGVKLTDKVYLLKTAKQNDLSITLDQAAKAVPSGQRITVRVDSYMQILVGSVSMLLLEKLVPRVVDMAMNGVGMLAGVAAGSFGPQYVVIVESSFAALNKMGAKKWLTQQVQACCKNYVQKRQKELEAKVQDLTNKVEHTLETHRIDAMVDWLSRFADEELEPVNIWPSLQDFLQLSISQVSNIVAYRSFRLARDLGADCSGRIVPPQEATSSKEPVAQTPPPARAGFLNWVASWFVSATPSSASPQPEQKLVRELRRVKISGSKYFEFILREQNVEGISELLDDEAIDLSHICLWHFADKLDAAMQARLQKRGVILTLDNFLDTIRALQSEEQVMQKKYPVQLRRHLKRLDSGIKFLVEAWKKGRLKNEELQTKMNKDAVDALYQLTEVVQDIVPKVLIEIYGKLQKRKKEELNSRWLSGEVANKDYDDYVLEYLNRIDIRGDAKLEARYKSNFLKEVKSRLSQVEQDQFTKDISAFLVSFLESFYQTHRQSSQFDDARQGSMRDLIKEQCKVALEKGIDPRVILIEVLKDIIKAWWQMEVISEIPAYAYLSEVVSVKYMQAELPESWFKSIKARVVDELFRCFKDKTLEQHLYGDIIQNLPTVLSEAQKKQLLQDILQQYKDGYICLPEDLIEEITLFWEKHLATINLAIRRTYTYDYGQRGFFAVTSEASLPRISGFTLQKITGDGNCLYRAVTYYLNKGEDVSLLRTMVAHNLTENAEEYREFIPLQEGQSLPDYIAKIASAQEWASNVEINILMRLLNRPIVIIGPEGTIRNQDDIIRYQEQEPIFVYYNGKDHYDVLLLCEGYTGKALLEQMLAVVAKVPQL